ncbi:ketopantoate reductase family protein [Allobacillus sp. GCM10007491]|uniref:2-dehydropantoate 2-reductase n=1 Tax=Allobacillus saliphilus TaxID=2912308 RepID=A0A941HRW1_9BACI|nr:2-dehydropantoate 2-reductase [Allobacillus saliphilus]MBR7552788.1 2-dehydropantoate 2-reductase [Allobacillus saliphilus]
MKSFTSNRMINLLISHAEMQKGAMDMNIAVIGMGAVGMFMTHHIAKSGLDVTGYVRREDQLVELKEKGVQLDGEKIHIPVYSYTDLSDEHDFYIIATKKTATKTLYPYLKKLKASSNLVFVQNGMIDEDELKGILANIFIGVFDHGITRYGNTEIQQKGAGQLSLGSMDDKRNIAVKQFVAQINSPIFPVIFEQNIERRQAKKLVINCIINPLTAIFECFNGEILENSYMKRLAAKLNEEACEALNLPSKEMWEKTIAICEKTARNKSSMFADIESGKRTEIAYLNGYLVNQFPNIVPTHEAITLLVKAKEIGHKR